MRYRDAIPRLLAPGWLQTPKNAAWLRASGDLKDSLVERCKAAVKARLPLLAPRDALDSAGAERQLERGPTETNASFAARVADAWNLWRYGGTALGMLTALRDAEVVGAYLELMNGRQFHLAPDGHLATLVYVPTHMWLTRSDLGFWSEFVVYFHNNPFGAEVPASDDPRVEVIRRIVRRWKSAHSTCAGIYLEIAYDSWGWWPANPRTEDDGTWAGGDTPVWGGTVQRYDA